MYVSPKTCGRHLESVLTQLYRDGEDRVIIAGDLNAIHELWDNVNNARGKEVVKLAGINNYIISPPSMPSYNAKGRTGESKPYILLDLVRVAV